MSEDLVDDELLPALPAVGGDVAEDGAWAGAGPDAASAAVLAALDTPARRHPDDVRPAKTRAGYARDWAVWGGRLSPDGCRIVITRTAERAGLETRLTGHSQRAGLITAGIRAGKRPDKVRAQSGHAAGSPVFEGYVRDARAREDAATDDIGL
ncbi:hypothetical protein [Streptomyces sp. BE303]|uniref:hypothetical protein n=1 Tax=Streptomyces sp. BE303 TaxID=3002528 RepID=UPI002E76B628|nr:hypothetical protein [Streptomyces sp. BE303]MED7949066.1 hypothetical protein [Streptomyces sp. BE303]